MLIIKERHFANYDYKVINKGDITYISESTREFTINTKNNFHLTIPHSKSLAYEEVRCIINYINQLCEDNNNFTKAELEEDILRYLKDRIDKTNQ